MDIRLTHQLAPGSILALFGPSGAGKTTLLRMLAGLTPPTAGKITVNGQLWYDHSTNKHLRPQKRSIGFVFQDYGLFPNMTVAKNIAFGLTDPKDDQLLEQLLDLMDLQSQKDQKPATLSGGQKQRVALARAMARKPDILLLDEPLSALDQALRLKLQKAIVQLRDTFQTTIIMVSHDLPEVMRMADEVIVIEKGEVVQKGLPKAIFANNKTDGKNQLFGEVISIGANEMQLRIGLEVISWPLQEGLHPKAGYQLVYNTQVSPHQWCILSA